MYDQYYQEKLPCGGNLKVSKARWEIQYYYPGIDRRHSGEFFTIYSQEMDDFIKALRTNFETYIRLKASIPHTGRFSTQGERDMVIAVDNFLFGVSIYKIEDFIVNETELEARVKSYEFAKKRASIIQATLQTL